MREFSTNNKKNENCNFQRLDQCDIMETEENYGSDWKVWGGSEYTLPSSKYPNKQPLFLNHECCSFFVSFWNFRTDSINITQTLPNFSDYISKNTILFWGIFINSTTQKLFHIAHSWFLLVSVLTSDPSLCTF